MTGYAILTAWLAASLTLQAQDAGVHVREERISFPTYVDAPPDPNPSFAAFHSAPFPSYPYIRRTDTQRVRSVTEWRVIVLENQYLSCRVLPDLGGHLHGCTDKVNGREIFYANPVIRPIAEKQGRGFIATGIECSFPIAHSRVSTSPVDFAYTDRDGAGKVAVAETDRVSGMRWRVEFILRAGAAILEQHVTLHNASAARRGYHWWTNAAIELDDPHLRFVYPVKWMVPHGPGLMSIWPVNDAGIDMSDVAAHRTGAGMFGHGSREPWMAVYKPKFRSGVAHYADPNRIRGKKIWLWGTGDKTVKASLTENFNSYVEMQAGEFETQPEFQFLQPGEVKTFTHYWIPFHDLSGISRVTPDAALSVRRTSEGAVIEINATHAMPGARIRTKDRAGKESETTADLDPATVYAKTLDGAVSPLIVDLLDARGAVLLHHVEGVYDALPFDRKARRPDPLPPPEASSSESDVLARGEFREQRDQFALAWSDYQNGLNAFPQSAPMAVAAGRVAFVLSRYDDAIRLLALPAASSAEAAYYYGAALSAGARSTEAQAALRHASEDPRWTSAARLQLAVMAAREGEHKAAASLIQALAADPGATSRTGVFEVAILRRAGMTEAARERLRHWLERDQVENALRYERTLLESAGDQSLWSHLAANPEWVLDLADLYMQMGAFDDALKLLDRRYPSVRANEAELGAVLPQDNPLVVYYRGFCRLKTGGDPAADFQTASALSARYVFPSRASSYPVLRAALANNDADAVAHALLGNLYFNSLETDSAIAEWRKALDLKRDLPAVHYSLGRALLEIKQDPVAALVVLRDGYRLNPGDSEIVAAMRRVPGGMLPPAKPGASSTKPAARSGAALPAVTPADPADRALVRSALDPGSTRGQFSAAGYPDEKQPDAVRRAYIETRLQGLLAEARARKCDGLLDKLDRLGMEDKSLPFTFFGFGAFMKPAHFQYYMGMVENACGGPKAARKRWEKVSRMNVPEGSAESVFPLLAALRLREADAPQKIDAAVKAARSRAVANASRMESVFVQGVLELAAGRRDAGTDLLQKSATASDPFIQYLSLLALQEDIGK